MQAFKKCAYLRVIDPSKKTDELPITMKFLLHKDIKETATTQMAHLVFANTRTNTQKNKRAIFYQHTADKQQYDSR